MALTLMNSQVSDAGIIPVVPVPVTNPHGREVNLINSALVIVLIHVVPITNLVLADLATSGPAVNILGEEHDVEGSYVHNLPEIFTPFGE
jgi:hypothetical protein